ncbi:23S rRNA (pseudouridine(1915)-N(3))-methyltransferase RlmH [Aerococcus sanguinicola]|uniref:23S rRNA (pseudouridine(1915)-N(3))-methyltransferase RlmH n=1 Tax=unclassified Aerococcus TaxID=2618060 RepID=UPI0008A5296C|nr:MULTISPECIES: 23S rRNA (pseudouridine(1915)-N(3))-methyltransferase RlmH [unclassified Aerococcus]MDK6233350.1 23S rRNA (pseudouridine(1915)-N(3))-methyltransferase RlmH [Aerococcus sp. UMB10185]MDK6855179.1 23S rRNA (pseudouridine(1915)-N(3))-methyltransferase RlmH [Aerococcus sp. UMB7533]MDK8501907.1 23S rRNA (pseudouridine(1915)-N(3))-methyltransferase RlmH [Aerococcus sp. UMB1112A]OFN04359.1 23S rRNA (pseudouridine(1915)-N(3))-methyltransferase RlmH [Aerococcus sp. HMSC062A02]OHO43080.1
MQVKLIVVGKLKEKYLKQGIAEYAKRLQAYCKFEVIEVKDEATPEEGSEAELDLVRNKEGERILAKIKADDYVVHLALDGDLLDSEGLAKKLQNAMTHGKSSFVYVIGGSVGTSQAVRRRADLNLSFGRLTLPHQLMRLVLVEQIYRSFRIQNQQPYHK